MSISLQGVDPLGIPADQVPPGRYRAKAINPTDAVSSGGHPEVRVDWRIMEGQNSGSEIRYRLTVHASGDMPVREAVQLLQAIQYEIPADVESREALVALVVEALKSGPEAVITVRMEPGYKDPTKEFSVIKGFQHVSALASDVDSDASGFQSGPNVGSAVCKHDGCDQPPVKNGLCKTHKIPF